MKKWCIVMCFLAIGSGVQAQQKGKNAVGSGVSQKQQTIPQPQQSQTSLWSNRSYAAKANADTQSLYIADPVIRAFNMRNNGANIRLSGSGVLGMPRGSYGFANGQVSLRTTDATSIGGITGNGSVGTGSTPGSPGTGGSVPWVNGKSVYAGPSIWGSVRGMNLPDSILRRQPPRLPD